MAVLGRAVFYPKDIIKLLCYFVVVIVITTHVINRCDFEYLR